MPPEIPSLKRDQKHNIIENLINDFNSQKPEKTYHEEIRDIIFSWIYGLGIPLSSTSLVLFFKLYFFNLFFDVPFLLFISPIILSSWLAGFYSGIIATLLGTIVIAYFFLSVTSQFPVTIKGDVLILMYFIDGILMSYFIANQRKAKARAEQVQLSFQLLLENTTEYGIIFLDKRGYITNSNLGTYHLTGYKAEELQGNFFSVLYSLEDKEKKIPEKEYRTSLRRGRSSNDNYLQKKNGTQFLASGFTTPLWTNNNQLYGFVKFFRDITEVRRQEKEKEDFISIAAHELRNPVSSISLYLQLLQKYYQTHPNKEAQNYLRKASSQIQRLLDLITTLLDVSQIQKGTLALNKEEVNINELIDEVIDNLQSSEKEHRLIRKGSITSKVMVDKRKIEEVLINLINNAIKYSPNAKRVLIILKNKRKDIVVSVIDFGIGMSQEVAAKVFERFYRGQEMQTQNIPGLGLGLYISSQIIHTHGGEMYVSSRSGKGSTFSFRIPKK